MGCFSIEKEGPWSKSDIGLYSMCAVWGYQALTRDGLYGIENRCCTSSSTTAAIVLIALFRSKNTPAQNSGLTGNYIRSSLESGCECDLELLQTADQ